MLFNFCDTAQNGKKYWLASAEVDRDIGGGFMRFAQTKTIELMYINKLGLQNELDKLGCFGRVKPEKVITRLGKKNISLCRLIMYSSFNTYVHACRETQIGGSKYCLNQGIYYRDNRRGGS